MLWLLLRCENLVHIKKKLTKQSIMGLIFTDDGFKYPE